VKSISWNRPLTLVAGAYVAAIAISVLLVIQRYFQYVRHPDDVAASGGMWAGGDLILEMFIVGMFLVITFFLMLVITKSETAYTTYAKVLVGLSLTAPFSVAVVSLSALQIEVPVLGWVCMFRLFASPLAVLGFALSRLFARFPRAKKLTVYAFLIETVTLIVMVALLFLPGPHGAS